MPTSATKSDNRRNRFRWRQQKPGLTKGNKTRVFASHNYEDKQAIEPTKENMDWWNLQLSLPTQKRQFHAKLYLALEQSQANGFEDVISWMPHGRAFKIVDKTRFEKDILLPYMNMKKYDSFVRQCNLYDFHRLTNASGRESSGASYNKWFLRGRPALLHCMIRIKKKGTNRRPASNCLEEPKFFSMPPCESIMNAVSDERNIFGDVVNGIADVEEHNTTMGWIVDFFSEPLEVVEEPRKVSFENMEFFECEEDDANPLRWVEGRSFSLLDEDGLPESHEFDRINKFLAEGTAAV